MRAALTGKASRNQKERGAKCARAGTPAAEAARAPSTRYSGWAMTATGSGGPGRGGRGDGVGAVGDAPPGLVVAGLLPDEPGQPGGHDHLADPDLRLAGHADVDQLDPPGCVGGGQADLADGRAVAVDLDLAGVLGDQPQARVVSGPPLAGREAVCQDVGVGGHDGVADLDRPAVGVIGRPDQVEDRDAGGQAQGAGLLGHRHPRADFLVEAVEGVPGFLQPGVDAAGAGVGLGDRGAAGDVEGDVGDGRLDGLAVEEVAAVPGQDLAGAAEPGGDVAGGTLLADDDAVDLGPAARLLGIRDERGLALLPVAAGAAVGGQPPDGRPRPDEDAAAVLGQDQALGLEDPDGVAHRHARDPVMLQQHRL